MWYKVLCVDLTKKFRVVVVFPVNCFLIFTLVDLHTNASVFFLILRIFLGNLRIVYLILTLIFRRFSNTL